MKRVVCFALVLLMLVMQLGVLAENELPDSAETRKEITFTDELFKRVKWLPKEAHPGFEDEAPGTASLFSSEYSEVVYIKTAGDLMDIDGHDGGYYEFKNDIDISGIDWKPINLTNATINGNGFSVTGLTVKDEPEYTVYYGNQNYSYMGLFDSNPYFAENLPENEYVEQNGIYITNLHLKNVNIDFTKVNNGHLTLQPFDGGYMTYLDDCSVSGKIDIRIVRGSAQISGMAYGDNCKSDLDITVNETLSSPSESYDYIILNALSECSNSSASGDLSVSSKGYIDSFSATGLENCSKSRTTGSFNVICENNSSISADVIYCSTDCESDGNITVNSTGRRCYLYVISDSENCISNGKISAENSGDGTFDCNIISGSENCKNNGNINAVNSDGEYLACQIISNCENSINNGEINVVDSGDAHVNFSGICSGSKNCTNNGKINLEENGIGYFYSYIIADSKNCTNNAGIDFKATGSGYHICYVIRVCENCISIGDVNIVGGNVSFVAINIATGSSFTGNISADGGVSALNARGIEASDNCVFEGNFTIDTASYAYGINDSDNCVFEGNFTIDTASFAYGIYDSDNCVFKGNFTIDTATNAYGIYYSDNCVFKGNFTINTAAVVHGIDGSDGCIFDGNFTVGESRDLCGIRSSNSCKLNGNIECNYVTGIYDSNYCTINGNITGDNVQGITGVGKNTNTGCSIVGNITAKNISYVLSKTNKSFVIGNVTAEGFGCISASTNCYIDGNVYATNGNVYGLDESGATECYNCYITGTLTSYVPNGLKVTASQSVPYQAAYRCTKCGAKAVFNSEHYVGGHCYDIINGELRISGYYECINLARYGENLASGGGSGDSDDGGDSGETPEPEPEPEPDDSNKIDYSLCVLDEKSDKPIEGATVTLDGNEYKTDANGVIMVTDGKRSCSVKIVLAGKELYTNAKYTPMPDMVNTIKITPLQLDVEDFNFGKSDSANVTGPAIKVAGKDTPLFDIPFDMEMDFFDIVKVAYDAEEKKAEVLLGTGSKLKDLKEDASDVQWENLMEDYVRHWERFSMGDIDDAYIAEMNSAMTESKSGKFGVEGSVSVEGFLNISLDEKTMGDVNGGMTVVLSGSLERSFCYPPMPLVYVVFGISGELGAALEFEIISSSVVDPYMDVTGEVFGSLTPKVGVGAGIRGMAALEIGLEGELAATAQIPFESAYKSLEVTLTGTAYALVAILGQEFPVSYTFTEAILYPPMSLPALMNLENEEKMSLVKRDYLEGASLLASESDTVKSNIYPYSQVQTAQLSDGRVLMVWLDDDISRSLANKTALYYSILENGIWSAPVQISNDGTADFEFDLRSSGTKAAIIWQNASKALPDTVTLSATAAAIELSYAEFDGSTWSEPMAITSDNSDYEYSPRLYYDGFTSHIIWTQNNQNSAMHGADITGESVYKLSISSGAPGEVSVAYDNLPYIYETAVTYGGTTACIADKDGNINTNDAVLYHNRNIVVDSGTPISALTPAATGFFFCQGGKAYSMHYSTGVYAMCYESAGTAESIYAVTNPKNSSDTRYVFEVSDGFASNLYMATPGKRPVPITDNTGKIRAWDAFIDSNGQLCIAAVMANVNAGSGGVSQTASLICTKSEPIENIKVNYIAPADEIKRGTNASFKVSITNNTSSELTSLNIGLAGDKAGVLLETSSLAVSIPAGETKEITVKSFIPVDLEKQNITATVSSDSLTNEDTSDNCASVEVGKGDLAVTLKGNSIYSDGCVEVVVENKGFENVETVMLSLEDEAGKLIYQKSLGSLEGMEKQTVKIDISDSIPEFKDQYDKQLITAKVLGNIEDEPYTHNNKDGYFIRPQSALVIAPASTVVRMLPGEISSPEIGFYPMPEFAPDVYMISGNEAVAGITEDGKIEAVSYGTAEISIMSPGLPTAVITVVVRDLGTPVITSTRVNDFSNSAYIQGMIYLGIDTTDCLIEGEKAVLIASAYDQNGKLILVECIEDWGPEYNGVNLQYRDVKPAKVKIMLWNSLSSAKPISHPAETTIIYPVYEPVPIIEYAWYSDNSGEEEITGEVEVDVNLRNCPDFKSALLISAAYSADGTMVGLKTQTVYSKDYFPLNISVHGKHPESVKVMLWNTLDTTKPVCGFSEKKLE